MAYDLVPQPRKMTVGRGGFRADMSAVIGITGESETAAEFLAESIWGRTSFVLPVGFDESERHVLWLSGGSAPGSAIAKAEKALAGAGDSAEAYGLAVTPGGIAAAAHGPGGSFYAAATASQLLERREGRPFWPACTISDAPAMQLRAVQIDLKHHMERFDYLCDLVARLASFKVNALVLELEDKFLYERRPEISAPIGISAEEMRCLVEVCRKYSVELIPLVQGLGHVSYILKHPRYAALREKKDSFAEFCPQQEGTYEVLFDLYEEVAEATEGTKYFHIGGDEAWLMGNCPRCAKALETKSKFDIYSTWLERCAGKVRELGRIPMVWDDMLIKDAGDDWSRLPDDLFYVRWNYRANAAETNRERIARYAETGLKVIVAAATQNNVPYVPAYIREHFPNIGGFGKAAAEAGLTGILTTAWEDSGSHTETFWPGYAATGQAGWNPSVEIDFEFLRTFTHVFHGASDGKLASVYRTLGDEAMAAYKLLAPEGPYKGEVTIDLPALAPAAAGSRWRDRHAEGILVATRLAAIFAETGEILAKAVLSGGCENSYALEVLLASSRVMLARTKVFFALRDGEIAVEDAHAAFLAGRKGEAARTVHDAAVRIYDALAASESALASLTGVWELTRYPQDMSLFETAEHKYTHDYNNYTHLAAKTLDNSYMILAERRMGALELAGRMMAGSEGMAKAAAWPF